jgi:hypothetical protein
MTEYRIITHGGCIDGFSSAYTVKKYFNTLLGTKLTEKQIQDIEVIAVNPSEIQRDSIDLKENDIVVDLPEPQRKVLFWCDHHASAEPKETKENFHWKKTPSCTSFLLDLAIEKGLKETAKIKEFKRDMDIIDSAAYTKEQIKECFYKQDNYDELTSLQKLHIITAMFKTRDRIFNEWVFRSLLSEELAETPIYTDAYWKLNPVMYHKSILENFQRWREVTDEYVEYDEKVKCVIQDTRKVSRKKGVVDRFYVYMKFDNASYGMNIRETYEGEVKIGIGCNIFHKERCKIDIGALCKEISEKYGEGSGGGHATVGGAVINPEHTDECIKYILTRLLE